MAAAQNNEIPMKLLLLGHRGARAHRKVPQNSLSSFDLALRHGCDGFEFDVRKSSDGVAVICHDPRWRGRTIAKTRALELGLPTLREVTERYRTGAFLDIEVKVPGLEEEVLAALRGNIPAEGYVISSFLPAVVKKLAGLDSNAPLGIICGNRSQLAAWRELPVGYVIAEKALADVKLVEEVHRAGKKIMIWTVNRAPTMQRLAKAGVDGIISDATERLVTTLGGIR